MLGFNYIRSAFEVISNIMPSQQSAVSGIPVYSIWMSLLTFAVRLLLLGIVVYIILIWPSSPGNGFDIWSARMAALPENVWYLIFMILGLWGTTEVVSTRARNAVKMKAIDAFIANTTQDATVDESTEPSSPNTAVDQFLSDPIKPNPSLEAWKSDATH